MCVEVLTVFDTAVLGGVVYDGSGQPGFRADVYLSDGKIALLHRGSEKFQSRKTIDAIGMAVSPGFIDMHSHDDLVLCKDRFNTPKVTQGVTTVTVGNCGMGAAVASRYSDEIYDYQTGVLGPIVTDAPRSFEKYLESVESSKPAVNVVPLVGHIPLRAAVSGFEGRSLSTSEMARMSEITRAILRQGALGISTGLTYQPVYHSSTDELIALGRIASESGALFAFHMRGYGANLLDSLSEVIQVAKESGSRVQVSHLRTSKTNQGAVREAVRMIEGAIESGVDIGFDNYPYTAGASILSQVLPDWLVEGGVEKALARLSDSALKAKAISEMDRYVSRNGPDCTLILGVKTEASKRFEGLRLAVVAQEMGVTPGEALLSLYEKEQGRVSIASFSFAQEDVDFVNRHPLSIIISDGIHTEGKPHPRLYGTFPKFIREYALEGDMPLEEALRKITSAPAHRLRLQLRGLIREGYHGDLTIFDPKAIRDTASYENPTCYAEGIKYVLVNGETVVCNGAIVEDTGASGNILLAAKFV
jgi:N-acyl-D-amino-acid deacylase